MGAPVLVYHSELDHWDKPFSLLHLDGEDATVLLPAPSGPTGSAPQLLSRFKSKTCLLKAPLIVPDISNRPSVHLMHTATSDKFETDPTTWHAVVPESVYNEIYDASRTKEFNGLVNKGVFTLVSECKAKDCRFYRPRFVDEIKHARTSDVIFQVDVRGNDVQRQTTWDANRRTNCAAIFVAFDARGIRNISRFSHVSA